MIDNHALILVEDAVDPGALDASALRDRLRQAESEADSAEEGSERRRVAQRDQRRYEAFLRIAEPSS
jgi:F0F1-type ATP synthase epsilon subunit